MCHICVDLSSRRILKKKWSSFHSFHLNPRRSSVVSLSLCVWVPQRTVRAKTPRKWGATKLPQNIKKLGKHLSHAHEHVLLYVYNIPIHVISYEMWYVSWYIRTYEYNITWLSTHSHIHTERKEDKNITWPHLLHTHKYTHTHTHHITSHTHRED